MILFVNACVRKNSRTRRLAESLFSALNVSVEELRLIDYPFPKVDEDFLNKRDRLIKERDFSDPIFELARQFEMINVVGITFQYTADGVPQGLCRADRLFYVTTAGGEFFPESFGFGYVKSLAENFYGIRNVELIKATGLDIDGAKEEQILLACEEEINRRFRPVG